MKRGGIRKNDRGDSLILVIGCIALLSVLGIVILAKSVDNQAMKITERQAQESFFAADSTSSELAGALEAISLEAVEDAFSYMMVQYGNLPDDATRKEKYKDFFEERLNAKLDKVAGNELTTLLTEAGVNLSGITIAYDDIDFETVTYEATSGPSVTDIIKVKNVKLTYAEGGSETSITTDIHIQTQVPDIKGGFRPTVNCYFADFALIADGTTSSTASAATLDGLKVDGNLYVGEDLTANGVNCSVYVEDATKALVKGDIRVEGGGAVTVSNATALSEGKGLWTGGIHVTGGGTVASRVSTNNANVYVADDLSVDGDNSNIVMKGQIGTDAACEYVGYNGGEGVSGIVNYEQNSAITINTAKDLALNLSGLKRTVLAGTSYIHEEDWDTTEKKEGIRQGESVAYKDMQAMYLIPGDCLDAGHNPVMGGASTNVKSYVHMFTNQEDDKIAIDLKPYLVSGKEVIVHNLVLDNGATEAAYVYLNFASPEKAAQYVEMYLSTKEGEAIKAQVNNLNGDFNSTIQLPTEIYAKAPVLTYDGATLTVRSAVSGTTEETKLSTAKLLAKQREKCLFSSLRETVGGSVPADYKMVRDGILTPGTVEDLELSTSGLVKEITVDDPDYSGTSYKFYLYNGDLNISDATYSNVNGILLVNGDVTVSMANVNISGLLLATGDVTVGNQTVLTANSRAIEILLTNNEVAKYFNGFGGDTTRQYLSSEAVDIKFENWKRND